MACLPWKWLGVCDSSSFMNKTFRPWNVDDVWLLPPSVQELAPEGHLAHFVRDLACHELDLSPVFASYTERRGYSPYHPAMMAALLLYAYSRGVHYSRRIARCCEERVDFMAVTANQRPYHRTISDFRRRHLEALGGLFPQVLALCRAAGLACLGHVSLDGTMIKANASKRRAMSYGRMVKAEAELEAVVEGWLKGAAAADAGDQVIVACGIGNTGSDQDQMVPMLDAIERESGRLSDELSADAGYCSENNLKAYVDVCGRMWTPP